MFPERQANYQRYRAAKRDETLNYLPIQLDIENVSRCNYRCTMCQVSDWPKMQRAEDMTFEDYKALIDSQYGLIEVKLQGMGEPLMGPCYFEMIEYARARRIWVRSTTNASLLRVKDNYKRLIDSDICELQVSIDGASQETYEQIRRGGNFDNVQKNCVLLNQYCRDVGRRRTRMWAVTQKDNFHEVEAFPALAAELGFERLTLSIDLNDWGQSRWRQINDAVDVQGKFDLNLAQHLLELGQSHGLSVTFWFIDEKYDATAPETLCPWPFERGYISSDMQLVPCCMIANPEVIDLGDARNLVGAWNGPEMRAFRRLHLEGAVPKICRSCYKR
jgi:pyrroloquinoline quinone biosynthesis protein E